MLKDELFQRLAAYGQEHLLRFWDELSVSEQASLADELRRIDYGLMARLARQADAHDTFRALADRAEEPPAFRLGDAAGRVTPDEARARGRAALAAGEVGALLVAGGQGSRLGFDHPKGMFPIGPVSQATLFQVHIEKVIASARRYGVRIPLCLMTSPATHEETLEFLAAHGRFGLPAEDLLFFCQGTMPAVDAGTGAILLAERGGVALSPDGHGGMLEAIAGSGVLDQLEARGIRTLFYFQVDNPLVAVCDPKFLGYHLASGSEMTTQVVAKQEPLERVGNVVSVDGRLHVIEYSDLPDEVARRRKGDGSLAIWAGSIAVHAMEVPFLRRVANQADALPFHRASKKVAYVDAEGRRVEPASPNAIKFERFIFDLLPSAENAVVVEIDPREAFAPLKNATGAERDTPEMVREYWTALHAKWLRGAGAEVAEGVPVEISPLWALDAEDTARKIEPGTRIEKATFLR